MLSFVLAFALTLQHAAALTTPTTFDSIGWSGSALMLPYHIGVYSILTTPQGNNPPVLVPRSRPIPIAGSSGGGYMAVASQIGIPYAELFVAVQGMIFQIASDIVKCEKDHPDYTPAQCYPPGVKYQRTLLENIPNTTRTLAAVNGKAFVQLTGLMTNKSFYEPYPNSPDSDLCSQLPSKNLTISVFRSKSDLIQALVATSFYSGVSSPNCSIDFRGMRVRDGGYALHLPCPPNKAKNCLRIEANIIPTFNGTCPGGSAVPNAGDWPDIWPGSSGTPLPAAIDTQCKLLAATTNPKVILDNFWPIFNLARADALAWLMKKV